MNKQDEEKALKIAEELSENREFKCDSLDIYKGAMRMAAWKEQQMIEKAVEWINIHMLYNASESYKKEIIENFKKYMEEN